MFSYNPPTIVLSPCIGICELDQAGYCAGCHRNASEIAGWSNFSDSERLRIMNYVLPSRESAEKR
jgi:uncharacterized protein